MSIMGSVEVTMRFSATTPRVSRESVKSYAWLIHSCLGMFSEEVSTQLADVDNASKKQV